MYLYDTDICPYYAYITDVIQISSILFLISLWLLSITRCVNCYSIEFPRLQISNALLCELRLFSGLDNRYTAPQDGGFIPDNRYLVVTTRMRAIAQNEYLTGQIASPGIFHFFQYSFCANSRGNKTGVATVKKMLQ